MVYSNSFFKNGAGTIRTIECQTYSPTVFALDRSGSEETLMSNGKSRFQNAVDEFEKMLQKLGANETLAENIHLTVLLFGGEQVECVMDGVALCDVKIAELCQHLRAQRCSGRTPMGRCIVDAIDRLDAAKEKARQAQIEYAQPVLCMLTDGESTDDLTEAKRRMDELANVNGQQKLVPVFLGVGEKGVKFPQLDMLLEKYGEEVYVATSAEDIPKLFRFLGKTVRAVSKGQYVVPTSQFGKVRTIAENAARGARPGMPYQVGGEY